MHQISFPTAFIAAPNLEKEGKGEYSEFSSKQLVILTCIHMYIRPVLVDLLCSQSERRFDILQPLYTRQGCLSRQSGGLS